MVAESPKGATSPHHYKGQRLEWCWTGREEIRSKFHLDFTFRYQYLKIAANINQAYVSIFSTARQVFADKMDSDRVRSPHNSHFNFFFSVHRESGSRRTVLVRLFIEPVTLVFFPPLLLIPDLLPQPSPNILVDWSRAPLLAAIDRRRWWWRGWCCFSSQPEERQELRENGGRCCETVPGELKFQQAVLVQTNSVW